MNQLNLFDNENVNRIEFRKALQEFNLDDALRALQRWQKKLTVPRIIDAKFRSVKWLQKNTKQSSSAIQFLVDLYEGYDEEKKIKALLEEESFLIQGLITALCNRLDVQEDFNFLTSKTHPADLFLKAQQNENAVQNASAYLNQEGEHAFVRQIRGYALYQSGDVKSASVDMTQAIFYDPLSCKEAYLIPPHFASKYHYLKKQYEPFEEAMARLPFELWKNGKTYIDNRDFSVLKAMEEQFESDKTRSETNSILQRIQFNRLLFLAESERLTNARGGETEELRKLREKMQRIKPELHTHYIQILKSFRNY
ncbi:MAG: hypothetical protein GF313_00965 [Caldithrix sp.]|nr:hypothetical protein [Caldithrix sp.]